MSDEAQDKIVTEALVAVQERERRDPMPSPQAGLLRAMGNPSELTSGSIGGSMIEAVTATRPDPWTPIVYEGHDEVPDGTQGPGEGAVMLMILAMELGREIGKRERQAEVDQIVEERDTNANVAEGLAERVHHELHDYGAYVRAMDEVVSS
jgi:hypothetical protein